MDIINGFNILKFVPGGVLLETGGTFYFADTNSFLKLVNGDLTLDLAANKTLKLIEPVWDDVNLGAALLSKPAASAPDTDEFKDSTGTDTGVETYAFAVGEKVSGSFELPHDYAEGQDFYFHVHWQGIAAPTGTDYVKWQITYAIGVVDTVLGAATTITKETAFDTQYEFVRSDFAAISGTGRTIGDQMLFQLSRVAAAGDAYAGDALIATVGLHYPIDTMGSRQIGTK